MNAALQKKWNAIIGRRGGIIINSFNTFNEETRIAHLFGAGLFSTVFILQSNHSSFWSSKNPPYKLYKSCAHLLIATIASVINGLTSTWINPMTLLFIFMVRVYKLLRESWSFGHFVRFALYQQSELQSLFVFAFETRWWRIYEMTFCRVT